MKPLRQLQSDSGENNEENEQNIFYQYQDPNGSSPLMSRNNSVPLRHSADLATWIRRFPSDVPIDINHQEVPNNHLSLYSCVSHESALDDDEYTGEGNPPISAHYYDSTYCGNRHSLELPSCETYRYSMPNSRSRRSVGFQDKSDGSLSYRNSLTYSSVSKDPYTFSYSDAARLTSSTPDSPPNSSLDYKTVYQDVPVIFHSGGGRRGGMRIGSGNIQDISLLVSIPGNVPKSPLSSFQGHERRSSRLSVHSCVSPSSCRIRPLSLSNTAIKHNSINLPDYEHDYFPSSYSIYPNDPVNSPELTLSSTSSVPNIGTYDIPLSLSSNSSESNKFSSSSSTDVSNLLKVLLAISAKYDFTHLHIIMTCHDHELNPNAPANAKLCYDFLNTGICKREQTAGVCHFRHLPPDHIETIVDRIRNGKMPVCLIKKQGSQYLVAELPSVSGHNPGELNKYAAANARLCIEYNLTGICPNEQLGRHCPYRHLIDCHPERIALLYRYGRLTEFESNAWLLSPCSTNEMNPFSEPSNKICFDFVNTRICKRNQEGRICRFCHCLSNSNGKESDQHKG